MQNTLNAPSEQTPKTAQALVVDAPANTNTFTAPFAQTPKTAQAVVVGACASLASDAPTNTVLLLTAGPNGALFTGLSAMPRATVTASSLVLFSSSDNGVTMRLIDSEMMAAQTLSSTTAIAKTPFGKYSETTPRRMAANDRLYVGSQVALQPGIVFDGQWSDF